MIAHVTSVKGMLFGGENNKKLNVRAYMCMSKC